MAATPHLTSTEERDIPVAGFTREDVPRRVLVHLGAVAALPRVIKIGFDIIAHTDTGGDVHLETVPVAVGPGGVTDFGAAGDVDVAPARLLEGDDPVDGGGVD